MDNDRVQRRLAAIFAADVVGYSRLMGVDEESTLRTLQSYREIIDRLITRHEGRIFTTGGDSVLAEFASPVEAVRCAIAIQEELTVRNTELVEDRRMHFRIGINVGDVMAEGDNLFGDGVNVAARLEGIAEAGGICISGSTFDQVRNKLSIGFEDIGPQMVKNIAEPVPAFRVGPGPVSIAAMTATPAVTRRWRMPALAAALVVIGAAGGLAWWQSWVPRVEPASVERMAFPLPDKPSIAVLPFKNMSNDKNQDYFADGIAEDVITDLSKLSGLFVIARNTSFQYRGGALDLAEVGRKLGVRYILEGSVRRVDDQVRINAQLIDARTGGHIWAERYDGNLANVFSVQDKVTGRIIDALKLQLTPTERQAIDTHGTDRPAAYDAYLRGLRLLSTRRRLDVDANLAAQAAFEEAIQTDPDYALAYAGLGWAKWLHVETINMFDDALRFEAFELAQKSIELGENALAHRTLAREHFSLLNYWVSTTRKIDLAVSELEAAAQLQPNNSDVLADLAIALSFAGRPNEALEMVQKAMERNSNHPDWYFAASGIAFLLVEKPNRAVRDLRKWSASETSWNVPYIFLASALALSGEEEQANSALARFDFLSGTLSASDVKTAGPFSIRTTSYSVKRRWPMMPRQEAVFLKGLQIAGMKDISG